MVLDTAVSTVSARVGSFKQQKVILSTHKATLDRYLQQAQNSVLEIANQRYQKILFLHKKTIFRKIHNSHFMMIISNYF